MKKQVLVYIDEDAVQDSIDLIEAARHMYGSEEFTAFALVPAGHYKGAETVFDFIFTVEDAPIPNYEGARIAQLIESLHNRYRFDAVLVPATPFGRIIAPRVAIRLGAGLVADVTEVKREGDAILLVRPAFSGRLLATVVCRGPGPIMMSVRPRTFSRSVKEGVAARILSLKYPAVQPSRVRLISSIKGKQQKDIRESSVLVAGGGGAMKDFPLLTELAATLGGMVAASRKAVDHGKAPREIQVGQSGKNVSPKLYFALGISGSSQHMAGLKNAEHIISVNIDPHAPICSMSDIVVQGDFHEFVTALIHKIKASKNHTNGGLQ